MEHFTRSNDRRFPVVMGTASAEHNGVLIVRWAGMTATVSVCRFDTAAVIGANVIAAMKAGGRRIGAPSAPARRDEDEP